MLKISQRACKNGERTVRENGEKPFLKTGACIWINFADWNDWNIRQHREYVIFLYSRFPFHHLSSSSALFCGLLYFSAAIFFRRGILYNIEWAHCECYVMRDRRAHSVFIFSTVTLLNLCCWEDNKHHPPSLSSGISPSSANNIAGEKWVYLKLTRALLFLSCVYAHIRALPESFEI